MPELPQISTVKAPDKAVVDATKPRRFKYLNLPFLAIVALIVGYGLLIVYTAVYNEPDYSFSRQLTTVVLGAVLMMAIWRFDYRNLSDFTVLLIIVNVVLILSPHLPIIGVYAKGAQSWINIGTQIQPGEFAKLTVILLAASVMSRYGGKLDDPREYLKALGIMLIPFLCIMTQPDLGTGLVYLFIAAVALVVGGARPKFLLITLVACILAVAAVFAIDQLIYNSTGEYKLLKQYQRNRLLVFLEHDSVNLSDEGYNLRQAQIAIGSGGLFGKGLFNATQATLGYLPEAPTDFIFCVLAEQLGFFGVAVLIALYAALVLVCFRIAGAASDLFGTVIVMCVVGMWLFQILENIGMTCGLMPITGIPLPFMSYGSSFMVVNFMLLGLIGSVWAHNGR
ncbi:FtsW/RodA/SpoVE family cell cycle protein [Raoultibacter phocaeensis]|uniref:FtsW/RodA/SpoVE family cell cycle protein n=1 Tax=Raoultibacter phocaeensis TaxID=2479841 RepID=UPI00111A5D33|nr:FtsW/RodA/SpoVE family cell cycle protein [Raoultibacter phocaeensis]